MDQDNLLTGKTELESSLTKIFPAAAKDHSLSGIY